MISFRFWEDEDCILSHWFKHEIALAEGDIVFLEELVPADGRGERMPTTEYEVQEVHTSFRKQGDHCMVTKDIYVEPT